MVRPAVQSSQAGLFTMPDPCELWRSESDGWVIVGKGPRLLARFQADDKAMRNLSLVALTDAGMPGKDLASLFSISPEHLSRLRTRVTEEGSAGLIRGIVGRPRCLSADGDEAVYQLFDQGNSRTEIASNLNVSRFSVSRALERRPSSEPAELPLAKAVVAVEEGPLGDEEVPDRDGAPVVGEEAEAAEDTAPAEDNEPAGASEIARIPTGEVHSRYAGAMLLHDFFSDTGAGMRRRSSLQPAPGTFPPLRRPCSDALGRLRLRSRLLLGRGHQALGPERRRGTGRPRELPRAAHAPAPAGRYR